MHENSKYRALSKNTILFTVNSFGSKIISFLLVPLYTYILSTDDYGTADLIFSTVSLLVPILTLNIQDAVLRFALDDKFDKKDIINIGIKHNFIGLGILLIVLYVLICFGVLKIDKIYILFLILLYMQSGLYNSFSMYLKAKDKVFILVISGLVNTLLMCFLNIIFLIVLKLGIFGYLTANLIGIGVSNLIMFMAGEIYRDVRIKINKEINREMILYSLPLVLNSVAWWINNASDKYILTFFCGVASNGIFSVAYKIPTILSTIQGVFYNAWSVSAITEFDKKDSDGFIGSIYTIYSGVSILGCSFIMIFNYPLARILYVKDFFEAWHFVPFLLLGATFNGMALFEGCLFTAVNKTKEVFKTTLVGALINAVANIMFIYIFGAIGAVLATLTGYFSIWLVRTIQVQKIVSMKVQWKVQIITLIFLLIQCVFALKHGMEWAQFVCLLCILIFQKKNVRGIIKKAKSCINRKQRM